MPRLRDPRYSQSLERGLAILAAFTSERPVMGIAEIAGELGMSRSTTHRYVTTLLELGYLEQGPSRKYRLALAVTGLGMSALSSLPARAHARGFLEELRMRCPYANNIAVLDGSEVLLLECVRGVRRGSDALEVVNPGARLPVYCTAVGKLLLAHLPESERHEMIGSITLERRARRTITSRLELDEELERIRAAGIATSSEEIAEHVHAIAAPVRDADGEVLAGVNLVARGSPSALEELVATAVPHVLATAQRISERLGYRPDGADH